jgi:hypothetical protein
MGIAEQTGIRPYTGQTAKEAKEAKVSTAAQKSGSVSSTDALGKPLAREVDRQLVGLEKRIAVVEEQLRLQQVRLDLLHDAVGVTLGNAGDALPGNAGNAEAVTAVTPGNAVTPVTARSRVTLAIAEAEERKRELRLANAERQKRWKARRKSQKSASSEL